MEILIYKTNISSQKKARQLSPFFNSFSGIKKWNVDTKDVDNVLRIEVGKSSNEQEIIKLVMDAGFSCENLSE